MSGSGTFAELLARARAGDREAMGVLTLQYEPKLRIATRVLLGTALRPYVDSVDLVQSVHRSLIVGLRAGRFDISSPENLLGLALTMVKRKVARQWRRAQKQVRAETLAPADEPLIETLASLSVSSQDPAQGAALRDQASTLWRQLDETEQGILRFRLAGHTTGEMAELLELHPTTLRVRIHRLRLRLRAQRLLEDWL